MQEKLEVRFYVSKNGQHPGYWSIEAASYGCWDNHSVFTDYVEAREVAKANRGTVRSQGPAVRVVEFKLEPIEGKPGEDSVIRTRKVCFDIIEADPTSQGNLPPILVMAIVRALRKGHVVEVEVANQ